MKTAIEKNQESIMNAIKMLNTSMKKQQGQVDSLQKFWEEEAEQTEEAKCARCGSNEDEFKDYIDELEDL
eukprot:12043883-Ditylum_brightwellii.AAC.1